MKRSTMTMRAACAAALIGAVALHPAQAQLAPPLKFLPPATVKPAAPTPKPGWCEEDCLIAPDKPLRFELLVGERASSGFAVTKPGAIRVEVQAAGAPLVLSLRRPDGRLVERQGSGRIVIDDAATAADIARGVLWGVGVRAAQEAPPAPAGAVTTRGGPRAAAGGTLSVQHPPADPAVVAAALKKASAETQAKAAQQPKPAAPVVDAQAQARLAQAAHDKQVAASHAATLGKLQATVPPAAFAQINQRIGLRLQGQTLQQASAAVPVKAITAKALNAPVTLAAPGQPLQVAKPGLLAPKTSAGSTQSAATGGVTAVGSGGGAAVAAPATPPLLAALSTSEGDPGTPVTLSGSDFGDALGEVHFIVANGRDVVLPAATYWSATQIVAEVPYADGIPAYDGHVYVKRADGSKSALRPFRFLPLYDVTEISQSSRDWFLAPSIVNIDSDRSASTGQPHHTGAMFWGFTGNDKFYLNTQLRNGWVASGARLAGVYSARPGYSGAYLVDSRPGTTSPYVEVRWWVDAAVGIGGSNEVSYSVRVEVKRPKNLPCAASPCPVL